MTNPSPARDHCSRDDSAREHRATGLLIVMMYLSIMFIRGDFRGNVGRNTNKPGDEQRLAITTPARCIYRKTFGPWPSPSPLLFLLPAFFLLLSHFFLLPILMMDRMCEIEREEREKERKRRSERDRGQLFAPTLVPSHPNPLD